MCGANLRKGYLEPAFAHLSPTRDTVTFAIVSFCFIAGMLAAIDSAQLVNLSQLFSLWLLAVEGASTSAIWRNSILTLHLFAPTIMGDGRS